MNHIENEGVSALFRWMVIAGSMISLLGIAQVWGVSIPTLIATAGPGSTFGNKNMAAQYLLFVLPAAFYLFLSSSESPQEWIYSAIAAFIATYLAYTGTRAAWGATAVAFLVLWFCLRARGLTPQELLSFSKRKWSFLLGIAVFTVAMNTIPPFFIPNFGSSPKLALLESMLKVESDPSAQLRFAIWANTLAIFRDHPLLGVGKGNFRFAYPLYNNRIVKDPSFTVEVQAAEAHNDYVQLLAEVGFLGTAAFLCILILLAQRYWTGLKEKVDPMLLTVSFSITAVLLEAFWDFPFDNPAPIAFFWIYAGILWGLTQRGPFQAKAQIPRKLALGIITFLAILATAASCLAFVHLRAEFHYSRAIYGEYQVETTEEKFAHAERDLNQAVRIYPYDFQYHHWRAVLLLRKGNLQEALQSDLQALKLNPYSINAINNLGVIYAALGEISKAIKAFETAIKIWPDYVAAHNNLGRIYENQGQTEKAVEEFQMSLRINPRDKVARERLAELLKEDS